ncbi:uncharacterized protein JCM10292_000602 [Rhodotorula paludigena]|uniref:uncharacterized protein n=1 Tax=Rhodotorula paludigena TaxID=86838 RepID=UPI003178F02A
MSHSDGYTRLLDKLRDAESAIERSIVRGAGQRHAEAAQKRASAWYTERRDDVPQEWYYTLNEEQQNELLSDVQDVVSYYQDFGCSLNSELACPRAAGPHHLFSNWFLLMASLSRVEYERAIIVDVIDASGGTMNFAWMRRLHQVNFRACHYGLVRNDKERYARNELLPRLCPELVKLIGHPSSNLAHGHPMRSLARGSAASDRRGLLSPGQQRVYQQTHASGW